MKMLITSFKVLFAFLLVVSISRYALAHCDTLDGPVVKDAQIALDKGDVTPVLKWVKKNAEPEVKEAFRAAISERKKGAQAKESSDKEFFETLIRVHRVGEGADFTGLKSAGAAEPIVAEADEALKTGSVDSLTTKLTHHLTEVVKERFARVLELNKRKDESVEDGRAYVEAYVEYVHSVEGIHAAAPGGKGHGGSGESDPHALDEKPRFTDEQINGRMWAILNDSDKLYYIVGLTEGINYCASDVQLTFDNGEVSPEVSKRVLANLGHLITGEKNKKTVEAVDNFYKDPLNLDIPVTSAYFVFVTDFKGFLDENGRKEMIEGMRKISAAKKDKATASPK